MAASSAGTPAHGNQQALAWFCTELPTLREHASELGLATALEAVEKHIRGGATVEETLRRHGLPPVARSGSDSTRGGPVSLGDFGIAPVPVTGAYRCPGSTPRCTREEPRDERGQEPRCAFFARAMVPDGATATVPHGDSP